MDEIKTYLFLAASIILINSCASSPRFTNEQLNSSEKTAQSYENYHDVLEIQTGIASYYADKFHGNITKSGDKYNMFGISAAHPTYPMDTIIRVTNLSNGISLVLKINDKMPKHPNRIIDLSYGAAKELDFVDDGLQKVKIEVLKWGEE